MKILVIDDTQKHLDSATETLVGHDVTLCASYDEALELLKLKYDKLLMNSKQKQYASEGLDYYGDAYDKAEKESVLPYWDAVLCDLLMPAGNDNQREKFNFKRTEMPVGWSLALVAASRGAKYVVVASDEGHHDHPGSAMLDRLKSHVFTIDGAKMLMTNELDFVHPTGGKNWGSIFNQLVKAE